MAIIHWTGLDCLSGLTTWTILFDTIIFAQQPVVLGILYTTTDKALTVQSLKRHERQILQPTYSGLSNLPSFFFTSFRLLLLLSMYAYLSLSIYIYIWYASLFLAILYMRMYYYMKMISQCDCGAHKSVPTYNTKLSQLGWLLWSSVYPHVRHPTSKRHSNSFHTEKNYSHIDARSFTYWFHFFSSLRLPKK